MNVATKPIIPKEPRMAKTELNALEFLQTFRRGELLAALGAQFDELVAAMQLHQSKGSLTLKLDLKMNKAGQIEIVPGVAIKKPTRALGTGIYFATDEGRLTRRDPNQMDIEDEIERRRNLDN